MNWLLPALVFFAALAAFWAGHWKKNASIANLVGVGIALAIAIFTYFEKVDDADNKEKLSAELEATKVLLSGLEKKNINLEKLLAETLDKLTSTKNELNSVSAKLAIAEKYLSEAVVQREKFHRENITNNSIVSEKVDRVEHNSKSIFDIQQREAERLRVLETYDERGLRLNENGQPICHYKTTRERYSTSSSLGEMVSHSEYYTYGGVWQCETRVGVVDYDYYPGQGYGPTKYDNGSVFEVPGSGWFQTNPHTNLKSGSSVQSNQIGIVETPNEQSQRHKNTGRDR